MNDVEKRLYHAADALPLLDTHEHMERTPSRQYPKADLFDIIQNTFYLWSDLVSSGMPPVLWDPGEKDEQLKWQIIRRYLPNVVNTGYYRGIVEGLRSIYEIDFHKIDDTNWRRLNKTIKKAYENPLWPEKVLKENTQIEKAINDVDGFNMNRSLFL